MKNFYEIRLFSFRNFSLSITLRRFPAPRSPRETGSADRYYGRRCDPSFTDFWGRSRKDLNEFQKMAYRSGYDEEEDRKVW